MRNWSNNTNPAKGFTLIEVMVAMAIIGLALLVLLNMGMVALDANDWSNKTTMAVQAMQEKLEYFRSDASHLKNGSDSTNGVYLVWEVSDIGSYLKKATVVATWEDIQTDLHTDSLTAYIRTDSL